MKVALVALSINSAIIISCHGSLQSYKIPHKEEAMAYMLPLNCIPEAINFILQWLSSFTVSLENRNQGI